MGNSWNFGKKNHTPTPNLAQLSCVIQNAPLQNFRWFGGHLSMLCPQSFLQSYPLPCMIWHFICKLVCFHWLALQFSIAQLYPMFPACSDRSFCFCWLAPASLQSFHQHSLCRYSGLTWRHTWGHTGCLISSLCRHCTSTSGPWRLSCAQSKSDAYDNILLMVASSCCHLVAHACAPCH